MQLHIHSRLRALILWLVMLGIVAGCGSTTPATPQPDVSPLASPLESPLATPAGEPEIVPLVIPTPSPGTGVVHGQLTHQVFEAPISEARLYLAPVLVSDDQKMEMARLDPLTAPQTTTDEQGRFVFADVEPNRYAVILGGSVTDYLLADFRTESEVLFELDPEMTLDLGDIWIVPPEDL